jgi:hypothetical protein
LWVKQISEIILKITGVASVSITYYSQNDWFKTRAGVNFPQTSLENMLYREIITKDSFVEIPDVLNHNSYKFIILKMEVPMIRYISAIPVLNSRKIVTGAITLIDTKRQTLSQNSLHDLENYSRMVSVYLENLH